MLTVVAIAAAITVTMSTVRRRFDLARTSVATGVVVARRVVGPVPRFTPALVN